MRSERHRHDPAAVALRLAERPKASYLRDFVYGGVDGAITTLAVVTGVWGAQLPIRTVIILGLANLFADGFSMAAGNYLASKSELEQIIKLRAIEGEHIDRIPQGEREEVRQIFAKKGFAGRSLEAAVQTITSDRERWIKTMLVEEYGLSDTTRAPFKAALATFVAFLICGSVPLISFLVPGPGSFLLGVLVTAVMFFVIGSLKSRWTGVTWWRSGLFTFAIGTGASGLAYAIGVLLRP